MDKKDLLMTLYLTKGIGNEKIARIMAKIPNEKCENITCEELAYLGGITSYEAFKGSFEEVKNHPEYLTYLKQQKMITFLDEEYPPLLTEMYQFPVLLFYEGDLSLLKNPSLAVVGTRKPLYNRRKILECLLEGLLPELTIVSGLALGTDQEAHHYTLSEKGKTIACLGNGLNYFYPKENSHLQKAIGKKGLLLSEYLPNTPPKKYHFPQRNRIIAGLSLGTLVLGAKEKSGSLITASWALEHNREVFAVPGNILEEEYKGSLQLIQAGAKCVFCSEDIKEELFF